MSSQQSEIRNERSAKSSQLYPKIIKGTLYHLRSYLSYFLLTLLFAGPFIRFNGEQLVLLNILERKFAFFGLVFFPQDFHIFVLATLTFIVFIILFTAIFGRVWCGWACPQTIFMEMLFRKIENLIEGDATKQKKLDASELNLEKFVKKGLKHSIFILLSFLIANVFLAYIIGSDALLKIISEPVSLHIAGFSSIVLFTLIFYLVFARFRELVCIVICPYGRLQGVLLDNKSIVVAYDYLRGEPRGKKSRKAEIITTKGDCIDCNLCVHVCPTGIDIRNGTQLECINCTACIDACNMVMEKIDRPQNLIGFKSEQQIALKTPFNLGKRVYGYTAIWVALLIALIVLIVQRTDIETTVLRAAGTLYQQRNDGTVSNLYNAELINKTSNAITFEIRPANPTDKLQLIQRSGKLEKGKSTRLTFFIIRPAKAISHYKSEAELKIISGNKVLDRVKTTFIGPPNL